MKAKKIDNASHIYKRQSRKREKKVIRCSILIVCEGTATEPDYFKSVNSSQQRLFVYDIKVEGIGRGTTTVAQKAIELKKKNNYDRVWAVFDKDEFTAKSFNDAITLCHNNGVEVAWSNEAFELWYLYHFYNVSTGLSRKQYGEKITEAVNSSPSYNKQKKYVYAKNDSKNFETMTTYGSMESAIKYAESRHLEYTDSRYAA